MCPYVVPASALHVPTGLEPITVGGRCSGLLAYVRYRPPSPLVYDELIWMPCQVRVRDRRSARGYWVARMYVDSSASLAGGRDLWALPKTLATFRKRDDGVDVEAEDGTFLSLAFSAGLPGPKARTRVATLQQREGTIVGFRGDFSARVRLATLRVEACRSPSPEWAGFPGPGRMKRPAIRLDPFEAVMAAPRLL